MSDRVKPQPALAQVADWLADHHDGPVADLVPLYGGFWSSAFAYRVGGRELVLRLSEMAEGFDIDASAMRFASADLPIPEVLDRGKALGVCYAISQRHHGRRLETIPVHEADAVGRALQALFAALRAVPSRPDDPVQWYDPEPHRQMTWHDWLREGLVDNPTAHVSGWRSKLESNARAAGVFSACESRMNELLPMCPERRDLVHGDLLHQNVLVSDDASRVTAVFSWKCSVRGDFLFDVAWCTFWSPWHPGIAAVDCWRGTLAADDLDDAALQSAASRHHCYELQIAASHLGWNAWINDMAGLAAVADAAEKVLSRGPLPA